jgi:lipopolysaccharide transport system permease protein
MNLTEQVNRRKFTREDGERWDTIIQPRKGWVELPFREAWEQRELLFFLVWRNLKIRYKQTVLGVTWAVLQPLFAMLVFTIFFGRLAKISTGDIPYPIFVYAGLVPWTFFANSLSRASNSLVENERLITKIYFPRLFLPAAEVMAGLVDFLIALLLLFGLMAWYGIWPTAAVWFLPLFLGMAFFAALGVSFWLSTMHVLYRDIRYVVTFLVQFWLFATPVIYPESLIPKGWQALYGLNPMVGVVEGFRWSLIGTTAPTVSLIAASFLVVVIFLAGGIYYLQRMEDRLADVI